MDMFAKIVADSINQFNNRITTFIVYMPYVLLNDFMSYDISGMKVINISYKRLEKREYTPSSKNSTDDYNWTAGIDFLKRVKSNMLSYSLGYVACIMTSTKWHQFFGHMLFKIDDTLKKAVPSDYINLLIQMEELYIDNVKNVKSLSSDQWHLSPHIESMVSKLNIEPNLITKAKVMYQYYAYAMFNLNPVAQFDYQLVVKQFTESKKTQNINLCNHIVKVPIDYNYLTNGSFDSKWDPKLKIIERNYNTMYDSYLCLYDIIERLTHLRT